jgi:hypothetical protein
VTVLIRCPIFSILLTGSFVVPLLILLLNESEIVGLCVQAVLHSLLA